MAQHGYPAPNARAKFIESQDAPPGPLGQGESWTFPGEPGSGGSEAFRPLILPEGHLPIITAGGQESLLLGVPGNTVDILGMGLRQVGCQGEGGLLRV